MHDAMKHWRTACGVAALFALLLVTAGALVEWLDPPEAPSGGNRTPFVMHFFRNWLIATLTFIPIMGGLRTGQRMSKQQWFATLGTAVLFGVLLVAPFAVMEYWNNSRIRSGEFEFPLALFYGLWLAPTASFLIAAPIVRSVRAGEAILTHPFALVLRVGVLTLVTIGWVGLLRDQMACFLGGVPGCDY